MPNKDTAQYFGDVIAYLLPGFLGLWAVAAFDPLARAWLGVAAEKESTVGAFLFALLASLAVGVLLNGLRWKMLDDHVFEWPKVGVPKRPKLDRTKLGANLEAYVDLREQQFRFFQFYGNTFMAGLLVILALLVMWAQGRIHWNWIDGLSLLVAVPAGEALLFGCARSCLTKYREETRSLLGQRDAA